MIFSFLAFLTTDSSSIAPNNSYQTGRNTYEIVSASSGKALEIADGTAAEGTNVQMGDRNGSSAQKFRIVEATADFADLTKLSMYRLYNPNSGEHFYTASVEERQTLVAAGWTYEGIGWYSDDAQTTPLYRVYNPNAYNCNHHYTTNAYEAGYLVGLGWNDEGIAWYGL